MMARCDGARTRAAGEYWNKAHRTRARHDWFLDGAHPEDAPAPTNPHIGAAIIGHYSTMATMPFSTLTQDRRLEHARWCEGCASIRTRFWTLQSLHFGKISANTLEAMRASIPPEYRTAEYHPSVVLFGLPDRAWSRESFARHIRDCPGAQRLLKMP
ncbi:hypothetical protein PG984_013968 [Apiospora sp. TS-2023a]